MGPITPGWRKRVERWWYVLRYHRPSQLAMRLIRLAEARSTHVPWRRRSADPLAAIPTLRPNADLEALSRRKLALHGGARASLRARQVLEGRYVFLNEERCLPDPIDWRLESWPEVSQLWRFHLHYQDYLLDLAAQGLRSGEPHWSGKAWTLVTDWIAGNQLSDRRELRDAWHPYCISRRLPVWIYLGSVFPPDPAIRNSVLASIAKQACYLEDHLEWDLGGNHLLENARALAVAGAFLDGPQAQRWLGRAEAILRKEFSEQILTHGEHFERSPMYHAQMLEVFEEIGDAVDGILPDLARDCHRTAAAMSSFLGDILHPDGQIPLLGDSWLDEDMAVGQLLHGADRACGPASADDQRHEATRAGLPRAGLVGDYWLYRSQQDFLLFDAGPVGPDHLPAHAHADLLTLEASVAGRRVLVDSGVFSYGDDPMRRYCRSTAAHNALQIDAADQCDMWSRFRMGGRGWPSALEAGETCGFYWARAQHNAYRRLNVPIVGRWLACRPGGPWFCVDWACGTGQHDLVSWLHFHPEVRVNQVAADELQLLVGGLTLRLRWLAPGQLTLTDGWYCPELGLRQRATVARWEASSPLPAACAWCLTWPNRDGIAWFETAGDAAPRLGWADSETNIEFQPCGKPLSF